MCLLAPSPARDVLVDPKRLNELHISWNPPLKPNGEVTHYFVYWQPQPLHAEKYHQRNYCDDSKLMLMQFHSALKRFSSFPFRHAFIARKFLVQDMFI